MVSVNPRPDVMPDQAGPIAALKAFDDYLSIIAHWHREYD